MFGGNRERDVGKTTRQLRDRTVISNAVVRDSPHSLGEGIYFHTSTDKICDRRSREEGKEEMMTETYRLLELFPTGHKTRDQNQ